MENNVVKQQLQAWHWLGQDLTGAHDHMQIYCVYIYISKFHKFTDFANVELHVYYFYIYIHSFLHIYIDFPLTVPSKE